MRNELNFWVVGGDMRQAKLAELLSADGHTVHTFALEALGPLEGVRQEKYLAEAELADCVVLPLPAAGEDGMLNAPLSRHPLPLAELFSSLRPGQVVCAGRVDAPAMVQAEGLGLTLCDYFAREELAVANAVPTALPKGHIVLLQSYLAGPFSCVLRPCLPNVYQFNPAILWRAAVSRCAPFLLPPRVYQMSTTGTFEPKIKLKTPVYHRIFSLLTPCKGRHTALISLFYRILG